MEGGISSVGREIRPAVIVSNNAAPHSAQRTAERAWKAPEVQEHIKSKPERGKNQMLGR